MTPAQFKENLIAELSKWPTEDLKKMVFEANTLIWKRAFGRAPKPVLQSVAKDSHK